MHALDKFDQIHNKNVQQKEVITALLRNSYILSLLHAHETTEKAKKCGLT